MTTATLPSTENSELSVRSVIVGAPESARNRPRWAVPRTGAYAPAPDDAPGPGLQDSTPSSVPGDPDPRRSLRWMHSPSAYRPRSRPRSTGWRSPRRRPRAAARRGRRSGPVRRRADSSIPDDDHCRAGATIVTDAAEVWERGPGLQGQGAARVRVRPLPRRPRPVHLPPPCRALPAVADALLDAGVTGISMRPCSCRRVAPRSPP